MQNRPIIPTIKVAVVGNGDDKALFKNKFDKNNNNTVGVNYNILTQDQYTFQIWNISSSTTFNAMLPKFLENSQAIILCEATKQQQEIVLAQTGNPLIINFNSKNMSINECLTGIKDKVISKMTDSALPPHRPAEPTTFLGQRDSNVKRPELNNVVSKRIHNNF